MKAGKTVKHPVRWFLNRVGKYISTKDPSLFNPPIKIGGEQHAKALFINQSKGYRYQEI